MRIARWIRFTALLPIAFATILAGGPPPARADDLKCLSTTFRLLGANDKVCISAFDDPKVPGVACHISQARTGGFSGMVGLAEDPSRFSIACRQVGPIKFLKPLPHQEEVFKESASFIFKHVRVVRIIDPKRNALTYLTYSDKIIDGSPDNAITAVAVLDQKIPLK